MLRSLAPQTPSLTLFFPSLPACSWSNVEYCCRQDEKLIHLWRFYFFIFFLLLLLMQCIVTHRTEVGVKLKRFLTCFSVSPFCFTLWSDWDNILYSEIYSQVWLTECWVGLGKKVWCRLRYSIIFGQVVVCDNRLHISNASLCPHRKISVVECVEFPWWVLSLSHHWTIGAQCGL